MLVLSWLQRGYDTGVFLLVFIHHCIHMKMSALPCPVFMHLSKCMMCKLSGHCPAVERYQWVSSLITVGRMVSWTMPFYKRCQVQWVNQIMVEWFTTTLIDLGRLQARWWLRLYKFTREQLRSLYAQDCSAKQYIFIYIRSFSEEQRIRSIQPNNLTSSFRFVTPKQKMGSRARWHCNGIIVYLSGFCQGGYECLGTRALVNGVCNKFLTARNYLIRITDFVFI